MFDPRKALGKLNGQEFPSGEALRATLSTVIVKHRSELPADFQATDLVDVLRQKRWLSSDGTKLVVKIPNSK